eukprot:15459778-Alexandrium_andersonii.AAC.1
MARPPSEYAWRAPLPRPSSLPVEDGGIDCFFERVPPGYAKARAAAAACGGVRGAIRNKPASFSE